MRTRSTAPLTLPISRLQLSRAFAVVDARCSKGVEDHLAHGSPQDEVVPLLCLTRLGDTFGGDLPRVLDAVHGLDLLLHRAEHLAQLLGRAVAQRVLRRLELPMLRGLRNMHDKLQ